MNTSDHKAAINRVLARIIGRNIRSSSSKALASEIAKETINDWAKDSTFKKKLAAPALWVAKRIGKPGKDEQDKAMAMAADMGILLTTLARKVNAGQASDKICNDKTRGEAIDAFLQNMDFGELKEMVEGSEESIVTGVRMFNTTIWDYPAKLICLASLLPTVANIILRSARETLVPLHVQAPDVLADVVFSLLRSLNGKAAGDLVNGLAEVIRQAHTGSALIGDQGLPQFGTDLRILLADFASALNPEVIVKARTALAEDMETIRNAWMETIAERPDLYLESLRHSADHRNPQIRATRREVDLLADLPKDEVNAAISAGLSDLDTQELGETINTTLRLLNTLRSSHPEALPGVLAGVAATIDTDELKDAASWIVPSAITAVKPLAVAIMPSVIRGLADLLTPEPGDDTDEMAAAIAQLKTALQGVKA